MRRKIVHHHLRHGASSAIPRLRSFFLRLLQCPPFFRSYRRFLLGFFIRFAFFGHTVHSRFVDLKPIIPKNDEWPRRVGSRYQIPLRSTIPPMAVLGRLPDRSGTPSDASGATERSNHPSKDVRRLLLLRPQRTGSVSVGLRPVQPLTLTQSPKLPPG